MTSLVFDLGSSQSRIGFSGDDAPYVVFQSVVGRYHNHQQDSIFSSSRDPQVQLISTTPQDQFLKSSSTIPEYLDIEYPIERGVVTHWDSMELLIEHYLNVLANKQHPNNSKAQEDALTSMMILFTEPALNPIENRLQYFSLLFERFQVQTAQYQLTGVLSVYASGGFSAFSIESGDGVTTILPIYEGHTMPSCIKRLDLGGRDITDELMKRLMERGELSSMMNNTLSATSNNQTFKSMNHYYQCHEQVKKIKEQQCSIRTSYWETYDDTTFKQYELPEGGVLKLCERDLQECGELMFQPECFMHTDTSAKSLTGLGDLIFEAVSGAGIDCRKDLYGNLVLSGGNTLMSNLGARVSSEMIARAPSAVKIKVVAPPERLHSAWIGGSILSSLSTFQSQWITRGEFHEVGPSVVFRKSLV